MGIPKFSILKGMILKRLLSQSHRGDENGQLPQESETGIAYRPQTIKILWPVYDFQQMIIISKVRPSKFRSGIAIIIYLNEISIFSGKMLRKPESGIKARFEEITQDCNLRLVNFDDVTRRLGCTFFYKHSHKFSIETTLKFKVVLLTYFQTGFFRELFENEIKNTG